MGRHGDRPSLKRISQVQKTGERLEGFHSPFRERAGGVRVGVFFHRLQSRERYVSKSVFVATNGHDLYSQSNRESRDG
jgi:hypothetical protein